MTVSWPRDVLCVALWIGFMAACAPTGGAKQVSAAPVPAPARASSPASPPGPVVTAEDLERQPPAEPIEMVLTGRFPGVEVTPTSRGVAVRIRGFTSILGSNEPLYVIDGVEIQPGPGGALAGINPHDIASIEVVKDPAGEAMYGVRGANGVIIIKTKRPD
jgi:TonB-dependent SusC/RagA subfamily outer membrane receptor